MKKTILLFLTLSLMLLVVGCSTDKKDEFVGTYQLTNMGFGDNHFMFIEKIDEKNEYKTTSIDFKEKSVEAKERNSDFTYRLEDHEKEAKIMFNDTIHLGMYYPKNKAIIIGPGSIYLKINDKKLSTEEMRKHIVKYVDFGN